jgi:hypothetical protein
MAVDNVATRSALAAVPSPSGKVAFLQEAGREGVFEFLSGDFSARVAADTLQGLYVASSSVPAASGCWVRVWDGVNGQPEWFGAVPNSGTSNCLPALNACVSQCPVTQFRSNDYWITSTWVIDTPYRTIISEINSDHYNTGHGTRIICTDPAKDVIQIGPVSPPGGGASNYTRNIKIEGIAALHSAGVYPPGAGQASNGVCGFRVQYVLGLEAVNLMSAENIIGFRCYGVVSSQFIRCVAFRSFPAIVTGEQDLFYGWYLQGSPSILAGGNASIYLDHCSATVGGSPALPGGSVGLYAQGNFVDTFIRDFESSALGMGVLVDGQDWHGTSANTQVDFRLENPVLDTCTQFGILIVNTNDNCQIEILNPYVGLLPGGTAGIRINQTGGQIRVDGGRMIGSGDASALSISQTDGVEIDGCAVSNFGGIICYVEYSRNCRILPSINNRNNTTPSAALYVRDTSNGYFAPIIKGKANAFSQGIFVQNTSNNITIDPTCVDTTAITGGAANKLIINGISITVPRYYTPSGAPGATGSGIYVTGITT